MSAIEDQLRSVMEERAGGGALDPEPYTHVRRRIRRTQRRRAVGAGGAAALVGVAGIAAGIVATNGDAGPSKAGQLAAITHERGRSVAASTVSVPTSGLTFRVDCHGTSQLVIRVDGTWFGGVDCERALIDRRSVVAALRPAQYAAYGLHRGRQALIEVTDTDPADRQAWTVRVTAGVPGIVQRLAPQPSALPTYPDLEPGAPGVVTPVAGHPNEAVDLRFTVPPGDIIAFGECYGPGRLRLQLRGTGAGLRVNQGISTCATLFGSPERDGGEIDAATLRGWGFRPGDHLVLRVIPSGFDRPTWRAAVQRITRDRTQLPLP